MRYRKSKHKYGHICNFVSNVELLLKLNYLYVVEKESSYMVF